MIRRNCSDPVSVLINISFIVVVVAIVVVVVVVVAKVVVVVVAVFVLYLKMFHMSEQKVQEQLLMRETLIAIIHEWKK